MESITFMVYKGEESTNETNSAVVSISADTIELYPDMQCVAIPSKDGSAALVLMPCNGAKFRLVRNDNAATI